MSSLAFKFSLMTPGHKLKIGWVLDSFHFQHWMRSFPVFRCSKILTRIDGRNDECVDVDESTKKSGGKNLECPENKWWIADFYQYDGRLSACALISDQVNFVLCATSTRIEPYKRCHLSSNKVVLFCTIIYRIALSLGETSYSCLVNFWS